MFLFWWDEWEEVLLVQKFIKISDMNRKPNEKKIEKVKVQCGSSRLKAKTAR